MESTEGAAMATPGTLMEPIIPCRSNKKLISNRECPDHDVRLPTLKEETALSTNDRHVLSWHLKVSVRSTDVGTYNAQSCRIT